MQPTDPTENDEVQLRGPHVMQGYHNLPEESEKTFTEDGWLMTGDVGEWVDGTHVKIIDRIKHIIITSGGKNITPANLETDLMNAPLVEHAVVVGDARACRRRAR